MITLFDDWVILINEYDYCLAKLLGTRTRKDGREETEYKRYGYYGSISGCLRELMKQLTRESLAGHSSTLPEACEAIDECSQRVERLLEFLEERECI